MTDSALFPAVRQKMADRGTLGLLLERVLVTTPPHLAEEDEASEGMAADAMPLSHAAEVETKVAVENSVSLSASKKKQQQPETPKEEDSASGPSG